MVRTGLDVLVRDEFRQLKGRRVGVVCNQASVSSSLDHVLDLLHPLHASGFLRIASVMGPQHGLRGHQQDNMIEWEGREDADRGYRIFSLYGENRKPTCEMLREVDTLVFDLQDVGARYYTFVWTLSLCMEACAHQGIPIIVLDRPNPIGGVSVEGPFADPAFASFVGLKPLLVRHGLTTGELATWLKSKHYPNAEVSVIQLEGWSRRMLFRDTGLPWLPPSPNMPTPDTALVYPGGCLIEGTNLSEGRGTTRPFEIVGAPFLNSDRLASALNLIGLPGVKFLPYDFQPTFQKQAGKECGGVFVAVTDSHAVQPVLTTTAIFLESRRQAGDAFAWRDPPYEYEYEKLPIDILAGSDLYRQMVDDLRPLPEFEEWFRADVSANPLGSYHLYSS